MRNANVDKKEFVFELETENRVYPISAKSESERTEWVKAIKTNVKRMKLVEKLEKF